MGGKNVLKEYKENQIYARRLYLLRLKTCGFVRRKGLRNLSRFCRNIRADFSPPPQEKMSTFG